MASSAPRRRQPRSRLSSSRPPPQGRLASPALTRRPLPRIRRLRGRGRGEPGRLHAGLATPHGASTRTRCADGWRVWNPVSGPVNSYHMPFKAIENLRTLASPAEQLALAATRTKTHTLLHRCCHHPCLRQLLTPSLTHPR